jgi:hypothetical protein
LYAAFPAVGCLVVGFLVGAFLVGRLPTPVVHPDTAENDGSLAVAVIGFITPAVLVMLIATRKPKRWVIAGVCAVAGLVTAIALFGLA